MILTRSLTAAVGAAAVAAALAGCGGGTKTITQTDSVSATVATGTDVSAAATDSTATDSTAKTGSAASSSSDPVTVKGRVGDTLTLRGQGLSPSGQPTTKPVVRVTLKGMRGPFGGFQVPAGKKLIGFDMHMVNVGKVKYSDPLPQGTLTLRGGDTGKPTSLIPVGGTNPCPNPSLKLKHGQAKNFCLAFEVPVGAKPQALQYAADNGYGDTGLWRLNK